MPWELTVKSDLAGPSSSSKEWPLLGKGDDVCNRISISIPQVEWHREPSFIEQHRHLPEDHPIQQLIASSTAAEKEWSSRAKFKGLYEGQGFTLELFVQDGQISFFHIDVRGGGNPMPLLARLCSMHKWAINDVTGKVVDLSLPTAPGWEEFTQWRDQAIHQAAKRPRTDA
jgi:hypothetical protein